MRIATNFPGDPFIHDECDECGEKSRTLVMIGHGIDMEGEKTWCLCRRCIATALALAETADAVRAEINAHKAIGGKVNREGND